MTPMRLFIIAVSLSAVGWPFASGAEPPGKQPKEPDQVSYYRDIRRVFQQECQGCHQPANAQGSFPAQGIPTLPVDGNDRFGVYGVKPGLH